MGCGSSCCAKQYEPLAEDVRIMAEHLGLDEECMQVIHVSCVHWPGASATCYRTDGGNANPNPNQGTFVDLEMESYVGYGLAHIDIILQHCCLRTPFARRQPALYHRASSSCPVEGHHLTKT